MPRNKGQLLVYAVAGAVLLLVGLNSLRGEKSETPALGPASSPGSSTGASKGLEISAGGRKLMVDVSGAVKRPGVYRFSQGARVIDAIARAGGPTGKAQIGSINRAATLSDGQQVVVPSVVGLSGAGVGGGGPAAPETPVSIGSATQEQLEEIDGIGPVTAEKIIEFRDSQGGIGSIDDLDQISGIGPVTMESLRSALSP